MSATPIPRTLALTFLGDMAVSELRHLPKHRTPTATRAFSETEKPEFLSLAWQRVRERAAVGERTFIVCPRIDPQDDIAPALAQGQEQPKAQTHAVLPVAQALEHGALSGLRIGVLHGRQDTQTQQETMARFRQTDGEDALDVLVTTTVIEVGVDVPQATLMVVLDAEYFGMSQLHQLRGRVGRGERPGLCLLVTQQQPDSEAMLRLDLVAQTQDGFELAAEDLRFRREGDLLGVDQSGWQQRLLLLDVLHDEPLVRQAATAVAQQDYDWISPAPVTNTSIRVPHPALRSAMQRLLRERSHMAGVANQDQEES